MTEQEMLNDDFLRAAMRGEIELLKNLLHAGADVNAQNKSGQTALMLLSGFSSNKLKGLEFLINNHANVNMVSDNGWTALLIATSAGWTENVELLLKAGADTTATKNGKTAYEWALKNDYPEVAAYIQQWELDQMVNVQVGNDLNTL